MDDGPEVAVRIHPGHGLAGVGVQEGSESRLVETGSAKGLPGRRAMYVW